MQVKPGGTCFWKLQWVKKIFWQAFFIKKGGVARFFNLSLKEISFFLPMYVLNCQG
ncbi:MAG: hypothetical protein CM1200mP30_23290 [Pseudomonadota bacterium]|nr:MAG: hypothetical protein CM1200mP30_23290 [Pseudomonadota bacterium]